MRILYTNFHQADGGGHTTYVLSLVRALRAAHDIVVAAPAGSRLFLEASGMPGVRVVPMEFKGGLLSAWPRIRRMRALLKIERFDLVHVNGAADHRLCMLASMGLRGGRPAIVYTQHTSRSGRSLGAALRARLATDRVICVSEHTRRGLMRSHYAGCGLRTVKNGVDVDYFTPATPEKRRSPRALAEAIAGRLPGGRQQRRHRRVQELAGHAGSRGHVARCAAQADRGADRGRAAQRGPVALRRVAGDAGSRDLRRLA